LAEAQRNEKNFAAANTTLKDFIAKHPKHELVSTARVAMAANLESMGQADDALMMYQSAVVGDPKGFNAPLALMSQVRLLKAKKQIEEARRICERVVSEHPESLWVGEAMRELRELKPPTPPAPTAAGPAAPPLIARPPGAPAPSALPSAKPK
jgi:TolA-binding protein